MQLLNPALDLDAVRDEYQQTGRVFVREFLAPALAEALHATLTDDLDWSLYTAADGAIRHHPHADIAELDDKGLAALIPARPPVYTGQYRGAHADYRIVRRMANGEPVPALLRDFCRAINSPAYVETIQSLTGDPTGLSVTTAGQLVSTGALCDRTR